MGQSRVHRQVREEPTVQRFFQRPHMVSKIYIKIYVLQYIYATNSYPQERETGVAPHDIQVFKSGHKGDDPSQPDKLCTEVAAARLVSC
jgi:hypothetical protein